MAARPVASLTLREKFIASERIHRELIEHLQLGFLPKLDELKRMVQPTPSGTFTRDIEDVTIRNSTNNMLESENFAHQLFQDLDAHCESICADARRIVSGE